MKIYRFKYLLCFLLCLGVIIIGFIGQTAAQSTLPENQSLTKKQQSIIPIAAYTAKGELQSLKSALNKGLDAGLTVNETKEAIVHLYAYCGFPRSIRGLQTLMTVLDERKAKGINDKRGAEASPIMDERSKYERGKEVLEELTGASQDGPKTGYAAFSPEIEVFLKEHLFADIFERDVLSYSERELVTISVLSSMVGVEPMLKSHFNICLNVGFSPGQLQQFVKTIHSSVGKREAQAAQAVLDEVLKTSKSQ
jgi:4-carboxymuconolactone decarboxylase